MIQALWDVPAPAKLNLFLHVTGRRDDGYHLLQSVFVPIDWADTLHFERRDDGRLQRHDLGDPLPGDDLCLRAARALQQASGHAGGVDIAIIKRVPSGAGMGGGSSDAASTLLALNRLWGLRWPRERLQQIALGLGADVPFFVGGRPAWVEGIGERLTPLELPARDFVVVKPPVDVPTKAIFASPLLVRDSKPAILAGLLEDAGALNEFVGRARNDLQHAAEHQAPEVRTAADWLAQRYGNSRMTGSGSAAFATVSSGKGSAGPSATTLGGLPPGWVGRQCRSLVQHPLVGWAG